jgi:hypothetical protein
VIGFNHISACLVTRGDVPMDTLLNSLPFDDVVLWDNSVREDLGCYGRFAAVEEAKEEWIYVQDDDLLVPIPALVKAHRRHRLSLKPLSIQKVVANVRTEEEQRFLGCGAIFHRDWLDVFQRYWDAYGVTDDHLLDCDTIFLYQNPYLRHWLGYLDFPWQTAPNSLYLQPGRYEQRDAVRERCAALCPAEASVLP